ncbi:MAG: hypothetical protein ACX93N_12995 [Pseudohaliea sp.]
MRRLRTALPGCLLLPMLAAASPCATADRVLSAYDPVRVEAVLAEAEARQAAGRHREALRGYRRAIHLKRINEGLDTPAQVRLLQRVLESQLALGLRQAADATHDNLYRLRLHHAAGPAERLAAATAYSDWKRERYLDAGGTAGYRSLLAMIDVHEDALAALRAEGEDGLAEVPHLYHRLEAEYLVSTYAGENSPVTHVHSGGVGLADYQSATDLDADRFRRLRKHNFRNGRQILERIIAVLEAQREQDTEALAAAKIALGDWYLWWHKRGRALANYREAWVLYEGDGDPATDPAALFPGPRELPDADAFSTGRAPDPYQQPARALVRFEVSRLGEVRGIEFLELEPDDAPGARSALYQLLKNYRFRPLLRDGEVVAASNVVRRYRYHY